MEAKKDNPPRKLIVEFLIIKFFTYSVNQISIYKQMLCQFYSIAIKHTQIEDINEKVYVII